MTTTTWRTGVRRGATVVAGAALLTGAALPATTALAAPKYQTNPAGNGVTLLTGMCGGEDTTVVANNNNSSDKGGFSAAHIYQGDTVLVPTSFTFSLTDFDQPEIDPVFSGSQTKGSGQQEGTLTCTFSQTTGDDGQPITFEDLVNEGELSQQDLDNLGIASTDTPLFTFTATVIPHSH